MVGNKNFTDVTKPSEIVQLLLNDDQLANIDNSNASSAPSKKAGKRTVGALEGSDAMRDLWNEEGDDFFGHSTNNSGAIAPPEGGEEEEATVTPAKGKKRKATAGARPRKAAGKGNNKKRQDTGTGDVTPIVDAE